MVGFSYRFNLILGYDNFYMMEKEEFKTNKFLMVGTITCIITLVLTLFGPIFYPNINLVMSLLDK